ncbi:hypothetical protein Neosp_001251 [[Neocosmospora] mangrovei]
MVVSDLKLNMDMFTLTKSPIFINRIIEIVDHALVGDGMADAQRKKDLFERFKALFHSPETFDMDKAEAAAAAYAELSSSGLPGMIRAHKRTVPKRIPPRGSGPTPPALKTVLEQLQALIADKVDTIKNVVETEQRMLGQPTVGVELKDLSAMRSELAACNDPEKVQKVLSDWTPQLYARSHTKVAAMLGQLEDLQEFLGVSTQTLSDRKATKEGGSTAEGDRDE